MVLKLNNNLFTTNRTVLKEFKTAGSKKASPIISGKNWPLWFNEIYFQLAKIVESREEWNKSGSVY